jgi:putative transposase
VDLHGLSQRKACRLVLLGRSSWHYQSRKDPQEALRRRLRELAMARPRYGYRRLHILLRREGWQVNAKRVWRLYCEEQLTVRVKRRKKRTAESRLPPRDAERPNEQWSLDFMHDRLEDGRSFRILNVIDAMTRECLACEVSPSFRSPDVTRILDREIAKRGKPERLRLDNGTEFTSNHFDCWAYEKRIQLHFTQPGRPLSPWRTGSAGVHLEASRRSCLARTTRKPRVVQRNGARHSILSIGGLAFKTTQFSGGTSQRSSNAGDPPPYPPKVLPGKNKVGIVFEGLRGEVSTSELCRREGIA